MNVEEYIRQNQKSIRQECQTIENRNSNAIITIKEDGSSYIYQVSTVEEFVETIPDNNFFKKMHVGINNAVLNKIIPIVIFEKKQAKIISFSDIF